MNKKRKGNKNEHKSISLLENMGYRCTRAAASLGEWDIVAISPKDVLLVQVKSNKWPDSLEMKRLEEFKCPNCVKKLIHRWDDYKRKPKIRRIV